MKIEDALTPEPFTIKTDLDARLIRFSCVGLWDLNTFDRYRKAFLVEAKKFQDAEQSFDLIGNLTKYPPQHQFLNEAREALTEVATKMGLHKCAIIASNPIVHYQVNRLSGKSHQFFPSEAEALLWIRS